MSFIGCTFNYASCTQATADYFIRHDGGDRSPVCSECLSRALKIFKGSRLDKVEPTGL